VEKKAMVILLAEDNPGDRRLVEEAFQETRAMHSLYFVNDGLKAISFLRREGEFEQAPQPDLMLLDLDLPQRSGFDVLAEMKNDMELRRIPVLVMTTSTDEVDVDRAYNLYANGYIVKPMDIDQLIRVIRSIEEFWLDCALLPGK
jgi:chemotaxis family two-component system response regulator Rcp1